MQVNPYSVPAASSSADARAQFIRRTYLHLALAVLAFVVVEYLLQQWSGVGALARTMTRGYGWLLVLGGFMFVSGLAEKWARSNTSVGMQYAGLGLYVVAQALLFVPLLYVATRVSSPSLLPSAALVTGLLFAGLTFTAFTSGKDFSFLRGALVVGGFVALGLIAASILFGFNLGVIFSVAMVAFASASILYQTSNVIRNYRTDQHVAAALALFASVTLLLWYVIRIFMSRD